LLRLGYFSNSPDQDELLKMLNNPSKVLSNSDDDEIEKKYVSDVDTTLEKKKIEINSFQDLLLLLKKEKKIPLLVELETNFKVLSFKPGEIRYDLTPDANHDLVSSLPKFLKNLTNIEWVLIRLENTNAKTLSNLKEEEDMKLKNLINQNDIVQEIKKIFPGSKIAKSSFH